MKVSNDWREILKKILRTLKSFLMGVFNMDYLFDSQLDRGVEASKFKLMILHLLLIILGSYLVLSRSPLLIILAIIVFPIALAVMVILILQAFWRRRF